MKATNLVIYAVTGALTFALLVPKSMILDSEEEGEPVPLIAPKPQQRDPSASLAALGTDTVLQREADGHFYAQANIEGAAVRFLVDTGASIVALTADDADAAGIAWSPDQLQYVGQGANGEVYGVQAMIREIELGGVTRRNVEAVVIPEGLAVSLLGQSYLSRIGNVDITGDRMTLRSGD